jgi:hypothetical protein
MERDNIDLDFSYSRLIEGIHEALSSLNIPTFWEEMTLSMVKNKPSLDVYVQYNSIDPFPSEEEIKKCFCEYGTIIHVKMIPLKRCAFIRFATLEESRKAVLRGRGGMIANLDYSSTPVLPQKKFSKLDLANAPVLVGFCQNRAFYYNRAVSVGCIYLINDQKDRLIRLYVDDEEVIYTFKYNQIQKIFYCEDTCQLLIKWAARTGPLISTFEDNRTVRDPLGLCQKHCHAIILTATEGQNVEGALKRIRITKVPHLKEIDLQREHVPKRVPSNELDIELLLEAITLQKIPPELITEEFNYIISKAEPTHLKLALRLLMRDRRSGFILDPAKVLKEAMEQVKITSVKNSLRKQYSIIDAPYDEYMRLFSLEITPTKLFLTGPTVDRSNRVLRKYKAHSYHFLRVTFRDDDGTKLNAIDLEFQQLIVDKLKNGVTLGGKTFTYLAYANSELKTHSCYLVAPFKHEERDITATDIVNQLGTFNDKTVAKRASRIGQCFSTTVGGVRVIFEPNEMMIEDITVPKNGFGDHYCFSDGIGKISKDLAKKLQFLVEVSTCAFQIRYGGFKGMVVVDEKLEGETLRLRASMQKFEANAADNELEVNGWAEYRPAFMNRQMIMLLLTLGTSAKAMEVLRNKMVEDLLQLFKDDVSESKFNSLLDFTTGFGGRVLHNVGYLCRKDAFVHDLLSVQCTKSVQKLIDKTRIRVHKGAHLYGVLDEYDYLKENQIFVRLRDPSLVPSTQQIQGPAFVTRSPSLHPGDIRMVECVDVPELRHLENVVVFPRTGKRPLTDMISGGDLDGDRYTVIWDTTLFPAVKDFEPMDFTKPKVDAETAVYPDSYINFFVKFMATDALGRIANAWLCWAEKEPERAASAKCIELAKKFSLAVDYPKTGVRLSCRENLFPTSTQTTCKTHSRDRSIQSRSLENLFGISNRC